MLPESKVYTPTDYNVLEWSKQDTRIRFTLAISKPVPEGSNYINIDNIRNNSTNISNVKTNQTSSTI